MQQFIAFNDCNGDGRSLSFVLRYCLDEVPSDYANILKTYDCITLNMDDLYN